MMASTPTLGRDDGRLPVLAIDLTRTWGGARSSFLEVLRNVDTTRYRVIALMRWTTPEFASLPGVTVRPLRYHMRYELAGAFKRPLARVGLGRVGTAVAHLVHAAVLLPRTVRGLARLLARERAAVLYFSNTVSNAGFALTAARRAGIPAVVHEREVPPDSARTREALPLVARHIAISSAVRDRLREVGVPDERIALIHNGVDLARIHEQLARTADVPSVVRAAPGVLRVGLFGRIVAWKGQLEFLQALALLGEDRSRVHAYIVGDCEAGAEAYEARCRAFAAEAGLEPHVTFVGYTPTPFAVMRDLDVVAHTSVQPEPFGRVVIEAMALGRVVVAADFGGPADIVAHGADGFLADPREPARFAAALRTVLELPAAERERIGAAARRTVEERFSMQRQVRKIERVFDEVAAASGSRLSALGSRAAR